MQGVLVEDEHHSCGPTIEEKKIDFKATNFIYLLYYFHK